MKNKIYHPVETVPKSNRKIVEMEVRHIDVMSNETHWRDQ